MLSPGIVMQVEPPRGHAVPVDDLYHGTAKRPLLPHWPATIWLNHGLTPTKAADVMAHEARQAWQYAQPGRRWFDAAFCERDCEMFAKEMRQVAERLGRAAERTL